MARLLGYIYCSSTLRSSGGRGEFVPDDTLVVFISLTSGSRDGISDSTFKKFTKQ